MFNKKDDCLIQLRLVGQTVKCFYVDYILTGYSTRGDVGSCYYSCACAAGTWIEARGTWHDHQADIGIVYFICHHKTHTWEWWSVLISVRIAAPWSRYNASHRNGGAISGTFFSFSPLWKYRIKTPINVSIKV